uniref:Uncharacterized protein n=1 Tax=Odontella aurita TaxID=265563 RepID=A0A7S4J9P6_9STRA|mmetsp:Transcript_41767/g.126707  ORF Transcript_41767/g.126707 Transcript_41767/m.126707 type:complete len:145 (+) Transcript_41767:861-1295(+)
MGKDAEGLERYCYSDGPQVRPANPVAKDRGGGGGGYKDAAPYCTTLRPEHVVAPFRHTMPNRTNGSMRWRWPSGPSGIAARRRSHGSGTGMWGVRASSSACPKDWGIPKAFRTVSRILTHEWYVIGRTEKGGRSEGRRQAPFDR